MKVLVACRTTVENPYVSQLVEGLSRDDRIKQAMQSLSAFWMGPSDFDILQLQWPEALFRWQEPSEWELGYLRDKLTEWSKQSTIITTVHNLLPHEQDTRSARMLYETVYNHSDGFIHLGKASRMELTRHFEIRRTKRHQTIPHGNYSCFPDTIPRSQARQRLGLQDDTRVCLSFGALRKIQESKLLIEGFKAWSQNDKRLIIAGRVPWPDSRNRQWLFLKWNMLKRTIQLHEGWIPDDEVQVYLRAADILVIPRLESLNSGNVALGFTFGRVVVGPDIGVIGEQLRQTGNPTFDPTSPPSLAEALHRALTLAENGHGEDNQRVAYDNWNWPRVAHQHVSFYERMQGAIGV